MKNMLNKGFTLVEMMIVLAIIGVLASIALPAYQLYIKRAYIFEGINLANASKSAIYMYYYMNGSWPTDNTEAGLSDPNTFYGEAVNSIAITDGIITISYNEHVDNKNIIITPSVGATSGSMNWDCTGGDMPARYRPNICRP